jgi:hypothetical protein
MEAYTMAGLARETGLTEARVKTVLTGVAPTFTLNNGYYKLYSLEVFRRELARRNQDILIALGYVEADAEGEL